MTTPPVHQWGLREKALWPDGPYKHNPGRLTQGPFEVAGMGTAWVFQYIRGVDGIPWHYARLVAERKLRPVE